MLTDSKHKFQNFQPILTVIKTIEAVQVAYELRAERYLRAIFISHFDG